MTNLARTAVALSVTLAATLASCPTHDSKPGKQYDVGFGLGDGCDRRQPMIVDDTPIY